MEYTQPNWSEKSPEPLELGAEWSHGQNSIKIYKSVTRWVQIWSHGVDDKKFLGQNKSAHT